MNILVFEINASMGIFLQAEGDFFKDHHEKIRQAMIKMILEKEVLGFSVQKHLKTQAVQ